MKAAKSRDDILAAVRKAPIPASPLPAMPRFSISQDGLQDLFCEGLALMGGEIAEAYAATDIAGFIAQRFPQARIVRSLVPGMDMFPALEQGMEPASLEDVDVAIVRAAFGVAETGSVFLSERELCINAVAYLAQHLVVLLDPSDILGNLHDAYARKEWQERNYGVLMTGPSATADIEGILIRGAQGVRSLTVVFFAPRI